MNNGLSPRTAEHFQGPDWRAVSDKRSGLVFHAGHPIEGAATVRVHWHYDGCVLDVDMDDGTKTAIHPDMGDDVVPLPQDTPVDLMALVASAYRRTLTPSSGKTS